MNNASDWERATASGQGHVERQPRTNLLLTASIEADALKTPVRIRNLSEGGAMLEGPAFPNIGGTLTLRRQELEIGATVVWRAESRCGVKFDGKASVPEWVAGQRSRTHPNPDQARIDSIQAAIRAGMPIPSPADRPGATTGAGKDLDDRIAEELSYVKRLLENVGDELSDAPIVVQRYARSLQSFDLACQILGHLSAVLAADNRGAAVESIGMDDLRARLQRKPLFRN